MPRPLVSVADIGWTSPPAGRFAPLMPFSEKRSVRTATTRSPDSMHRMETTCSLPEPNPWAGLNLLTESAFTSCYEGLAEVGRGGMGVVYRACHERLDRDVAIEVMLPGPAGERFLRECRLLAMIESPYVVTVHDFESLSDDYPMPVMEWVVPFD